jgi:undecaprenyl-diphosphatase
VGWLNWLFVDLSRLGSEGLVFLVVALFLAVLWRRPWLFAAVLAADAAADLISLGLRDGIGRRRPPLVYPEPKPLTGVPHSGSFPSGHAATAFACATVLAWTVPRLAVPAFVLAVAIAWSRVYVGVHWPLDVLGGAALGVIVATALLMLVTVRRRSRPATPAG